MQVPMLEPAVQNKKILAELKIKAQEIIESGQYILGKTVTGFEEKCSKYLKSPHCLGVSSGTDALLVALMACGIGPGDEVICPAFTFFATAGSVARLGAKPVFVDIQSKCFTLNINRVAEAITPKTKAIIPVHLFGQMADMTSLIELVQKQDHKIYVIEDVAQAMGATLNDKQAGTVGDIGCFSFFPSKNLGGLGDGGLVCTNDKELHEKMLAIRNHGAVKTYDHQMIGGNFRIDALQAGLLHVKLCFLDHYIEERRKNAAIYNSALSDNELLSFPKEWRGTHTYNQYTLLTKGLNRDLLQEHLAVNGVGSAVYYPIALHKQKCFQNIINPSSLPVTEHICNECLSIPVNDGLTEEQVNHVKDCLADYTTKYSSVL